MGWRWWWWDECGRGYVGEGGGVVRALKSGRGGEERSVQVEVEESRRRKRVGASR